MRKLHTPEDRSDTPANFRWGPGNAAPDAVQEQKREAILAAAAELFNRNGYMRTSLTDVAQSLALTKAALYYYFKDKQSLLFACSLVAHQGAQRVVEEALRDDGGANGLQGLSVCLQRYALHVMDGNFQSVMFLDSREFSDEQVTQVLGCRDAFDRGLRELIQRGVDDGSIRPCDPKLASLTLLGAVNWIARWYRPGGALSIEAVAEQVVSYALTGIATPAGVSSPAGRRAPAP
ncbi:TetR/AcrR family transcriptional regulator [Ramlibacter sp.]|uniref:TetR/AcrR family transcriptional regulator n=1 Tax=Ramlibacter sp. TaxID=1917967 RepID=UPI0017FB431C|nr:TetR/AcrR family transcriptional regulator [Ramlibacter sp.]MBA2673605.1 TetR/AcrR family transcriptional regulator [Ramlibacter sp.]